MSDPAARRLTRQSVEDSEPLQFPGSAAGKSATARMVYRGVPVDLTWPGANAAQVEATIDGLLSRSGWAAPAAEPIQWSYTADGMPICPKHGAPMKKRERQGDTWYSHNMGTEQAPCYCRGYPGKDSPGYDR